ncbi:unnamed protein product [Cylicocyclus nassatus]|uniref:Uncharacterized protein n=1 Tax=Cylicocyclus nassatus TaxID=53992 RepID=A0AA36GM33_CYLNA|nr:unnamed protein product [Cylicocyclus nassatus]
MRVFKLTFLLLTILMILSAVDVGECGKFKEAMGKVGRTLVKVVKTGANVVKKVDDAIDHFGGNIVPKVLDKLTGH